MELPIKFLKLIYLICIINIKCLSEWDSEQIRELIIGDIIWDGLNN